MKKLFALMFCATALLCTGCSDDDDNTTNDDNNTEQGGSDTGGTVNVANLIGTWELYKTYYYDEWFEEYGEEYGHTLFIEFKNNGICFSSSEEDGDKYEADWNYKLEGNILTLYNLDYPEDPEISRIDKLTSTELVLAYDYEGDDGEICTDKEYFKRVK